MIRQLFQRDNIFFGIFIGVAIPALLWLIIAGISSYFFPINPISNTPPILKQSKIQLICIFVNVFLIRYYLLRLKFDRTGRGILLSTFIMAIAYFYIHLNIL